MRLAYIERSAFGKGFEDARYGKSCNKYPHKSLEWEQYEHGQQSFKNQDALYRRLGPKSLRSIER